MMTRPMSSSSLIKRKKSQKHQVVHKSYSVEISALLFVIFLLIGANGAPRDSSTAGTGNWFGSVVSVFNTVKQVAEKQMSDLRSIKDRLSEVLFGSTGGDQNHFNDHQYYYYHHQPSEPEEQFEQLDHQGENEDKHYENNELYLALDKVDERKEEFQFQHEKNVSQDDPYTHYNVDDDPENHESNFGGGNKILNIWSKLSHQVLKNLKNYDKGEILQYLLPKKNLLKKIARIRRRMDPQTLQTFVLGYNTLLSKIGGLGNLSPHLLNSLKISWTNFNTMDKIWTSVDKLLEDNDSSLEEFLKDFIPHLLKSSRSKRRIYQQEQDEFDKSSVKYTTKNKLSSKIKYGKILKEQLESKNKMVSDQEPSSLIHFDSTVQVQGVKSRMKNGHKKSNSSRIHRRTLLSSPSAEDRLINSRSSSYADYGGNLYGNEYEGIYGKHYYYPSLKKGSSGGKGYSDNSYGAGHHSYATSKGYGGGGGGWGSSGYGGHGGGHSGGHGGGHSGAYGLGGLDPFSILGGLAFLVYLGLLFQQSLNNNAPPPMMMGTGRFSQKIPEISEHLINTKHLEDVDFYEDVGGAKSQSIGPAALSVVVLEKTKCFESTNLNSTNEILCHPNSQPQPIKSTNTQLPALQLKVINPSQAQSQSQSDTQEGLYLYKRIKMIT